jgi:hypothetical protein
VENCFWGLRQSKPYAWFLEPSFVFAKSGFWRAFANNYCENLEWQQSVATIPVFSTERESAWRYSVPTKPRILDPRSLMHHEKSISLSLRANLLDDFADWRRKKEEKTADPDCHIRVVLLASLYCPAQFCASAMSLRRFQSLSWWYFACVNFVNGKVTREYCNFWTNSHIF